MTLGEVAYTAYGAVTDFKNYQGLPMPMWEDLTPKIREAWEAAAVAAKKKADRLEYEDKANRARESTGNS